MKQYEGVRLEQRVVTKVLSVAPASSGDLLVSHGSAPSGSDDLPTFAALSPFSGYVSFESDPTEVFGFNTEAQP